MGPLPDNAFAVWGRAAAGDVRKLAEQLCAGDPGQVDEVVRAAQNCARKKGPAAFLAWVKSGNTEPNAETYRDYLLELATKECYGIWWRSEYKRIVGKAANLLGQKDGAEDFAQDASKAALRKRAHCFIDRAHENSRDGRKLDTPQKCFLGFIFVVLKKQAPRRRGQRTGAPGPDHQPQDPERNPKDRWSEHRSVSLADLAAPLLALLEERVQWDKETVADGIGRFQVFERLRLHRNRVADVAAEKGITEERVQTLLEGATDVLRRWHAPDAAELPDLAAIPLAGWQLKKQVWFEEEAIKHGVGMFELLRYRSKKDHLTLKEIAAKTGLRMTFIEQRLGLARSTRRDDERTAAQEIKAQAFREGLNPEDFSQWAAE